MTLWRTILRETWGLFVDDGSLAVAALLAVAASALLVRPGFGPLGAALALIGALLAVLVENVVRFARRRRP